MVGGGVVGVGGGGVVGWVVFFLVSFSRKREGLNEILGR